MIEFIFGAGAVVLAFNIGRFIAAVCKIYYYFIPYESLRNQLFPEVYGEACFIDEDGQAQICDIEFKQIKVEASDAIAVATETADGYWLVEYSKKKKSKPQDIDFEIL